MTIGRMRSELWLRVVIEAQQVEYHDNGIKYPKLECLFLKLTGFSLSMQGTAFFKFPCFELIVLTKSSQHRNVRQNQGEILVFIFAWKYKSTLSGARDGEINIYHEISF